MPGGSGDLSYGTGGGGWYYGTYWGGYPKRELGLGDYNLLFLPKYYFSLVNCVDYSEISEDLKLSTSIKSVKYSELSDSVDSGESI